MFKKKRKKIKDIILEKSKEEELRKEFSKTHKIDENTKIVIEQKSKILNFFLILIEIIKIILRILLIVIICILSTIGGTVLLNEAIRDYFFSIVQIPFNIL